MPFLYVYVCDLLEDLGHLVYRPCPMLVGLEKETNKRTVNWLQRHKNKLNEFSVDAQAVLMFFTPHKQTDREYGLDAERLEQLIARVLNLSSDQRAELQLWRKGPVHGDLAACVQQVMEKMTGVRIQSLPRDHHFRLRPLRPILTVP
jgi:DNA ligase-4